MKKESARTQKNNDKQIVMKSSNKVTVVCMDVQRVLLVPSMTASSLYYKTKLVTHNFTLLDQP